MEYTCQCTHWGSSYTVGTVEIVKCHACGAEKVVSK